MLNVINCYFHLFKFVTRACACQTCNLRTEIRVVARGRKSNLLLFWKKYSILLFKTNSEGLCSPLPPHKKN